MVVALATVGLTINRLDDWLTLRARTHGDRPAVVAADRVTSYRELEARARSTARRLAALGVGAGDRVATSLPASLAFAELLHALPKLGAVLVPLDARLTAAERRERLDAAAARLVVEEPLDDAEADADLRGRVRPDDPQTLLFTSGTTGRPKPVLLSYRNHAASALASAWNLGVAPDDRWLCALPLSHVGGLAILLRSAVYGTAAVVCERFETDAVASTLAGGGATLVSLVPTMLARLLEAGLREPAGLRAALVGGAAAPAALLERARNAGVPVVRTYGMTETASQVAATPLDAAGRGGRCARPLPGVELSLADDGELLVRGPMVARGSVSADGWLHTGDRARLEDGDLQVDGRIAEVIVTGGENVAAREVEEALLSHPEVADAAVSGEPDPEWGEAVTAYVVPAAGTPLEPVAVIRHCRGRLAGFKVPKAVHVVPELPRNAAGKLERDRLAALI